MLSNYEFTARLGLALLLGAAIGVERQWRQKSAGLRTNTLVSMGSAAFILLSVNFVGQNGDPGRIAAQIVTGIGFLGAGVIMKDGMSVQGLNTAATIWCSAAVGCLAAAGLFVQALIVTVAVMLTHLVLRPLGIQLSRLPVIKSDLTQTEYLITIKCRENVENHIRVLLMQYLSNDDRLLLRSLSSNDNGDPAFTIITAEIRSVSPQESLLEKFASRITVEKEVSKVSWEVIGQQADV